MLSSALITLALALSGSVSVADARITRVTRQVDAAANAKTAAADNERFKTLNANSPCNAGDQACIDNGFAQCVGGKFVIQPCGATLICSSLPLVNAVGTTIACDTQADIDQRFGAAGGAAPPAAPPAGNNAGGGAATGGGGGGGGGGAVDLQTSLTLDPSVIAKGFADDGQNPPVDGQTASSTSTNNYINFCALTLPQVQLTNGQQVLEGSCNAAPIGLIPSVDKMPSAKFSFPANLGTVPANQDFTVTLNVKNFQTGTFTNALKTYFAAPQTLNAQGEIIGHSHITIEALTAIDATTPLDPKKPFFFKGINTAAVNGVLSVVVTGGVKAGPHRMCTINSSSNHQPVIVPVAQHGSLDDCIYFTGV